MSYDDTFDANDFYATPGAVAVEDPIEVAPEIETVPDGVDVGQGEADGSPTPTYFDPTAYSDHLVKVKVDGEEIEVPVTEMVQGYQRQADYTRKTQELSFWRQVDQAMQVDPAMTIQYLQKTFNVNQETATAMAASNTEDDDWSYDDPVKRELNELRQLVQPLAQDVQQRQAETYLRNVVNGLASKYGDEFNATEVIQEAVNRGIQDPGMLEPLFKELAFERYRAQAAAKQVSAATTAATEAQRRAAAANAAVAVSSGGSATGGRAVTAEPAQPKTVWEAYQLAKVELGL